MSGAIIFQQIQVALEYGMSTALQFSQHKIMKAIVLDSYCLPKTEKWKKRERGPWNWFAVSKGSPPFSPLGRIVSIFQIFLLREIYIR